MPPFLPRKRLNSTPPDSPQASTPPSKKPKLHDIDRRDRSTLQANREFDLGSDSESSLSDVDSDEFEDVPHASTAANPQDDDEDHDDIDWEDAVAQDIPAITSTFEPGEDLQLKLTRDIDDEDQYGSLTAALGAKKGPSKIERRIRIRTHCLHVQFLMFHNAIRNNWIGNREVQQILVKQLPPGITKEIEQWKINSGLVKPPEPEPEPSKSTSSKKGKSSKRGRKSESNVRNERDWGPPSQAAEKDRADMIHGDPLIPLLKVLVAYWKRKFRITAPGLRKTGYRTKAQLRKYASSLRKDPYDPQKHGERIKDLDQFKELAKRCEGSRDVGAQLFTALLRGIGIEARMVANIQPIGFGWTKAEEAVIKNPEESNIIEEPSEEMDIVKDESIDENPSRKSKSKAKGKRPINQGNVDSPIDLDSDGPDSLMEIDDDDSIVDVTQKTASSNLRRYDKDLPFPIYWTEVISPMTQKALPVSAFIGANCVATSDDLLAAFEPRGAKADKAKQVIAYVIAFSPDGSAKDVTTRYLKRRMWPGKTKGFRIPVEKVPIYDKRGKIKRYEEYDWFKTVMSGYSRRDHQRTAADDLEDSTDLVPQQPEKKAEKEGDTLQSLKSSAEFVLERHLRREEALKSEAKAVRTFLVGKGDNAKEENVYLRADVVKCLSAESWHKEGRQPKMGEVSRKLVPVRAVTLMRKREIEEQERATGEKATQGLYSVDQTEWIIPPPIRDGIIPKNAYGNIDCFVPSMIPQGAVHIPLRGSVRICKKLGVDYAEAVTGFEFGNKMAVPIITGVIVAKENEDTVIDAWEEYEAQQRIKEEAKQQKGILAMWRKMIMGLRIKEKIQDEYADVFQSKPTSSNLIDLTADDEVPKSVHHHDEEDTGSVGGGGFLLPEEEEEESEQPMELVVEHNDQDAVRRRIGTDSSYPTPISANSSKKPAEQDQESTESSPLSSPEPEAEELQRDNRRRRRPTKTQSQPTTTKKRNKPKSLITDDDDQDSDTGNLSDPPSSLSSEEEYIPKPTRSRR